MITINVTQEDIDKAMAIPRFFGNWGEDCPIGQALHRENPNDRIWIYTTFIAINGKRYDISPEIQNYIRNVDTVRHGRFTSDVLLPVLPAQFIIEDN